MRRRISWVRFAQSSLLSLFCLVRFAGSGLLVERVWFAGRVLIAVGGLLGEACWIRFLGQVCLDRIAESVLLGQV